MSDYQPITATPRRAIYTFPSAPEGTVVGRIQVADHELGPAIERASAQGLTLRPLAEQKAFVLLAQALVHGDAEPGTLLPPFADFIPGHAVAEAGPVESEALPAHLAAARATLARWRELVPAAARHVDARLPDGLDAGIVRAALEPAPSSQSEHAFAPEGSVGFVRSFFGQPAFVGLRRPEPPRRVHPLEYIEALLTGRAEEFVRTHASANAHPDNDPGLAADFEFPEP